MQLTSQQEEQFWEKDYLVAHDRPVKVSIKL